jgi:hypothetical protein
MRSATSKRRSSWTIGLIFVLVLVLVAGCHYVNPIIRTRIERAMNRNLIGYQTHRAQVPSQRHQMLSGVYGV